MNLSNDKRSPEGGIAGAGTFGGCNKTASAQFTVGDIGFGSAWTAEDTMAASIIRLECENDELRAEVALLREEQPILAQFKVLAESLVKTQVEMKQERGQWRECAERLAQWVRSRASFELEALQALNEFERLKEGK